MLNVLVEICVLFVIKVLPCHVVVSLKINHNERVSFRQLSLEILTIIKIMGVDRKHFG